MCNQKNNNLLKSDLLKIAKSLRAIFKDISEIEQDVKAVQEEIGVKVNSYSSSTDAAIILRIDKINPQTPFPMGASD